MNKKIIIFSTALLLALAGYFYFRPAPAQTNYLTETVMRGDLAKTVIASGTVRSYQRVQVGAQVSGQVKKIHVQLGQQVQAGQLLAEIDSTTQANALSTAQAKLNSYQAQLKAKQVSLEVAKSAYQRMQNLYKQKSASLDEVNNAKNSFSSAESAIEEIETSIKQAEIEVNTAKTNLGYTKILSPIAGTVISIPVAEGQTVNAMQSAPTIVQVADLSKMLIKPEISEGDITKIKAGMKVRFNTLAEPNTQYEAEISAVDPALTTLSDNNYSESVSDTNAVYYYANMLVDNQDNHLRIGMTTQNNILIAEAKDVLFVPSLTIKKQGNKAFVQVLKENNQVEQREVELGIADDMHTEIRSGLQEGEKVVSSQVAQGEQVGNSGRGFRPF